MPSAPLACGHTRLDRAFLGRQRAKADGVISVSTYHSLRSTEVAPRPTDGYLRPIQFHVRPKEITRRPTKGLLSLQKDLSGQHRVP